MKRLLFIITQSIRVLISVPVSVVGSVCLPKLNGNGLIRETQEKCLPCRRRQLECVVEWLAVVYHIFLHTHSYYYQMLWLSWWSSKRGRKTLEKRKINNSFHDGFTHGNMRLPGVLLEQNLILLVTRITDKRLTNFAIRILLLIVVVEKHLFKQDKSHT